MKVPTLLFLLVPCTVLAAPAYDPPRPLDVLLWDDGPPGMTDGATRGYDDGTGRYWNVGIPSLWIYTPETPAPKGGRIALVVCCGGGYSHLTRLVGADGAVEAFLPRDAVVVALRYRLEPPSTQADVDALADAKRAIRLLRANAAEWGIRPNGIGLFGWSAGANLALNLASHFDEGDPASDDPIQRVSSRPDFVGMWCPWPMRPPRPIDDYPIGTNAPPAFIGAAADDKTAPATFAKGIAAAYEDAGVAHHLWVTETGGHGAFAIGGPPDEGGAWVERFWPWLQEIGVQSAP